MNALVKQPSLGWILESAKYLGIKEIVGEKHNPLIVEWVKELGGWWRDDEMPWCGVFVAICLKRAGVQYPKEWYRALAYSKSTGTKLNRPAYGCVAVKTRKGGGHVCFVVGRCEITNKLICRGGNQGNKVCDALYDEKEFTGFYWYGTQKKPSDIRYTLPVYKNLQLQNKVTEA